MHFQGVSRFNTQKLAQLLQGHDTDTNDDQVPIERSERRVLPESLHSHAVCHLQEHSLDIVVTYTNAPTPTPRAQIGGVYYPFIPSTNEGFSCTSNCVGRRAYVHERTHAHAQSSSWWSVLSAIPSTNEGFLARRTALADEHTMPSRDVAYPRSQIESTHSNHSPTSTPRDGPLHLHTLVLRVSVVTLALLSNPLCRTFTGDFERVMNHAEAIEEVAEQALEAGQPWKHLAEARGQTTLQKLEHAMRTTLDSYVPRHRSEFDLAVGIRRSISNTHTVHRPTTFVPSCSNFFSVKYLF